MDYAELEIGLSRDQGSLGDQAGRYLIELRFDRPSDDAERAPVRGGAVLDLPGLLALQDGAGNEYGVALAQGVFADTGIRQGYAEFKAVVEGGDGSLRVKLFVDRSAPELHRLRWELLTDPVTGVSLATSERIVFSRFGASDDWRPVRIRPKAELRALVAVSNPANLAEYGLAPVDAEGEVGRARDHLQGMGVAVAGMDAPLSLQRLLDGLRDGVDVLYLVCHGGLHPDKGPLLYLQDESGAAAPTGGAALAERIGELVERPRLVVLASCESAGSEQESTQSLITAGQLVPLAPALAEAGVHAVLAMQGRISMETVKTAMPLFFAELLKDGQIDRALAVARGAVRDRADSWMPALFLRLKGGRIWYEPGFGEQDFLWDGLVDLVRGGEFTPIVGPGVGERVYGSLGDAARELAEEAGFPFASRERSELPQVAQFLRYHLGPRPQALRVTAKLKEQILERQTALPPQEAAALGLPELMARVGQSNRADPADPYRLLASLPARVFLTANPDSLLQEALEAEQKTPDVSFFDWRAQTADGERYDGKPTAQQPLVYHVFGRSGGDSFVVLTEDDYFDYLISWNEYKERIPNLVGYQTTNTSLLFLGFQPTDLGFRVLMRLIKSQGGSGQLEQCPHVAVQIDPDEDNLINAARARRYLETYFKSAAATTFAIYWGSPGEFLAELQRRVRAG